MSDQLQKLTKLLEFLRKTRKLNGEMARDSWFDILSCDDPEEDVLAYHFLFYFLFARVIPERLLIEKLFLVLMSEEFSVEWILSISQRCLVEKLGFEENLAAKMMKDLVQDLQIKHGSDIPMDHHDLTRLWGIDDRAATLYLNYAAERPSSSMTTSVRPKSGKFHSHDNQTTSFMCVKRMMLSHSVTP